MYARSISIFNIINITYTPSTCKYIHLTLFLNKNTGIYSRINKSAKIDFAISGSDVKVFSRTSAAICGEYFLLLASQAATAPPSERPNTTILSLLMSGRLIKKSIAASESKYSPTKRNTIELKYNYHKIYIYTH